MKTEIRKDQKINLQTTLLLVRQTFEMIYYSNNTKTSARKNNPIEKMCSALGLTTKKLQGFILSDSNKIPKEIIDSCTMLESIGFPSDILEGQKPLNMSKNLLSALEIYFDNLNYRISNPKGNEKNADITEEENEEKENSRINFLNTFREEFHTISNPDGSSFLECVVRLYNYIYHPSFDDDIFIIKDFLKNTAVGKLPKPPKEYNKIITEKFYSFYGMEKDYQKPTLKSHAKEKNNFPKLTATLKLKINLFLIRETLLIYMNIDNMQKTYGLSKFYKCLNTSEKAYDNAVSKEDSKHIYFLDEFIRCGFPANLFRKDSPTLIPMSNGVKKAVFDYYNDKIDIMNFREKFHSEFVHKIDSDNALLAHIASTLLDNIKQQ